MHRKMNGIYPASRMRTIIQDGKPTESSIDKTGLSADIFESVSIAITTTIRRKEKMTISLTQAQVLTHMSQQAV